jgi:hypothetical protein
MYKLRIQEWGLRKNLRFHETKETLERMIDNHFSSYNDEQRDCKLSSIHSYIQRLPGDKKEVLMNLYQRVFREARSGKFSGISTGLAAADDLHLVEKCINHLRIYALAGFAQGLWTKNTIPEPRITELLASWYHISIIAQGALRHGRMTQAFRVLQRFFDQYSYVLSSHDPRLFVCTIAFATILSTAGPEVGAAVLKFATQMSETVHGQSSPYFAAMRAFMDMKFTHQHYLLATLIHSYYQFLEDQVEPDSPLRHYLQQYHDAARIFLLRSDLDLHGQYDMKDNYRITQELDMIAGMICNDSSGKESKLEASSMVKRKQETPNFILPPSLGVESSNSGNTANLKNHFMDNMNPVTSREVPLATLAMLTDLEQKFIRSGNFVQGVMVRQKLELLLEVYCGSITN